MRSPHFEDPQLFVVKAQELPLSGLALLELMRAVLAKGVPFRFCARGWSMAPFILDGDVITVSPLRQAKPRLGEVVAYVRPGTGNLVVHRVIARRAGAAIIQGDNRLENNDEVIGLENILGRITNVERNEQPVWIGLGPERIFIAWLSREKLLIPLQVRFTAWLKRFS